MKICKHRRFQLAISLLLFAGCYQERVCVDDAVTNKGVTESTRTYNGVTLPSFFGWWPEIEADSFTLAEDVLTSLPVASLHINDAGLTRSEFPLFNFPTNAGENRTFTTSLGILSDYFQARRVQDGVAVHFPPVLEDGGWGEKYTGWVENSSSQFTFQQLFSSTYSEKYLFKLDLSATPPFSIETIELQSVPSATAVSTFPDPSQDATHVVEKEKTTKSWAGTLEISIVSRETREYSIRFELELSDGEDVFRASGTQKYDTRSAYCRWVNAD